MTENLPAAQNTQIIRKWLRFKEHADVTLNKNCKYAPVNFFKIIFSLFSKSVFLQNSLKCNLQETESYLKIAHLTFYTVFLLFAGFIPNHLSKLLSHNNSVPSWGLLLVRSWTIYNVGEIRGRQIIGQLSSQYSAFCKNYSSNFKKMCFLGSKATSSHTMSRRQHFLIGNIS